MRVAKFLNLPELTALFKESVDIQTVDVLNFLISEAKYVNVILKPSQFQKDMTASYGIERYIIFLCFRGIFTFRS